MLMREIKYEVEIETYWGSDKHYSGTMIVPFSYDKDQIRKLIFERYRSRMGDRDYLGSRIISDETVEYQKVKK